MALRIEQAEDGRACILLRDRGGNLWRKNSKLHSAQVFGHMFCNVKCQQDGWQQFWLKGMALQALVWPKKIVFLRQNSHFWRQN